MFIPTLFFHHDLWTSQVLCASSSLDLELKSTSPLEAHRSNAAARHVIINMNAKWLLASRASLFTSDDLVLHFFGRRHRLHESLVARRCVRPRDNFPVRCRSVEPVWLAMASGVHWRPLLSRSSSSCQGVMLDLHRCFGCSLSEQFTFELLQPAHHALDCLCCFCHVLTDLIALTRAPLP